MVNLLGIRGNTSFSLLRATGHKAVLFFKDMGRLGFFTLSVLKRAFTSVPDRTNMVKQMYFVGVQSLPVILITGAFTGMVLSVQSYYQLRQFSLENSISPIVGLSMARELGPVLTALMLAGRIGAAFAAELGSMKVTEQIDALISLATDPLKYLVVPRFWACVFLLPFLTTICVFIGIAGAYFISVYLLDIPAVFFLQNLQVHIEAKDIYSGLFKSMCFGGIIALISCYRGFFTHGGAEGVGAATTSSVVLISMSVLISDFFLTMILF